MDFELSEDLVALQDMARKFAAEHIAPHARKWDREADLPRETNYKFISNQGHLSPSYAELLRTGLGGVLDGVRRREAAAVTVPVVNGKHRP